MEHQKLSVLKIQEKRYTRASFWNFSFTYYYCTLIAEIRSKIRALFKLLVSKSTMRWRLKGTSGNFYKRQFLPVIILNKKYLVKRVVTIRYMLKKTFFAVTTFENL